MALLNIYTELYGHYALVAWGMRIYYFQFGCLACSMGHTDDLPRLSSLEAQAEVIVQFIMMLKPFEIECELLISSETENLGGQGGLEPPPPTFDKGGLSPPGCHKNVLNTNSLFRMNVNNPPLYERRAPPLLTCCLCLCSCISKSQPEVNNPPFCLKP